MRSPFKTIIVYDLETGGLKSTVNSITEIACVAVNMETLEIVDEFSAMIKPYMDLSYIDAQSMKQAKAIFVNIATPDPETKIKTMQYKGKGITLKTLEEFASDLDIFNKNYIDIEGPIISYEDYLKLEKSEFADVAKAYFDNTYNPQALEITHMSREMFVNEGVDRDVAFKQTKAFIEKHTQGNSKPIIAGHNIKGFDDAFLEKFFGDHGQDLYKLINTLKIDTLEWARIRWFELANFALGTCANEVGLTLKEAHRALPDTVANAKFLIKMLKNLRGEGGQQSKYVRRKFNCNF